MNMNMNMKSSETQAEREKTRGFCFPTVTNKIVKADDAAIPSHLWNDRIALGLQELRKELRKTRLSLMILPTSAIA